MKKIIALCTVMLGVITCCSSRMAIAQNRLTGIVAETEEIKFTTASDDEEGGLYGKGSTCLFRTWNKYLSWSPEAPKSSSMNFKPTLHSREGRLSFISSPSSLPMQTRAIYKSGKIEQDLMALVKNRLIETLGDDGLDEMFIELTYYDFDKDGKREVVLSFVDYGSLFIVGYVLKFTDREPEAPWEYLAEVRGQTFLYVNRETEEVVAPVGSQGLFDAYRFDGKEFVLSDSSFEDRINATAE